VPEADAVGLAPGQTVRLRMDAAADRVFGATVSAVSPVASPRDRDDPQKFFQVEADIDQVDADLMRVGSRLRAEIVTGEIEDGIVLPSQSVFGESGSAWVFVMKGAQPERRAVELGRRSPDLVEIRSGVEPGERVSLALPPGEA
jgi:membrane fusion protein (multidrug efflux system)